MPESTPSLRSRVLAGAPTVGTFLNIGSSITAEICATAGYDWVLIDLEHGSGTAADLLGQLQAVTGTGATPLVRVELPARTAVSRSLDPGAHGIMFPRIDSAAVAREAIAFMHFPPDGVRGVAGANRMGRFGRVPVAELGTLDDDLLGVIQVETLGAMKEIEAIAAVDGVDVLFVGPADLSYALGVPGRMDDPGFRETLAAVVAAAIGAGKAAGILVGNVEAAERHLELGFRFIGIGSDTALVMTGAAAVTGFRAAAGRAVT